MEPASLTARRAHRIPEDAGVPKHKEAAPAVTLWGQPLGGYVDARAAWNQAGFPSGVSRGRIGGAPSAGKDRRRSRRVF